MTDPHRAALGDWAMVLGGLGWLFWCVVGLGFEPTRLAAGICLIITIAVFGWGSCGAYNRRSE